MSEGGSASQLSESRYAESSRFLLQLVQELRAIGGQAVVDLPRVVVIGNQSAGKSSVVEAISGINVPRDSGTCTRCPMECRLRHSNGPWTCQISIRWEYDEEGKHKDQVSEVLFGEVIKDKRDVELALRRAQAAVLNPHIQPNMFLDVSEEDIKTGLDSSKKPLAFSRNVVCVDLQGPDLVDLAFIDLPGIIQNNTDEQLIPLVQNMVASHIKGNSLILITIPMTDDIDNQKAITLAREADPRGERTIGVLTKPDVIGRGSKSKAIFLDIIEGRLHPLRHGYYCTRQPDDEEREGGITPEQARKMEQEFFQSTDPWSMSSQPQRFGIKNLVKTLSPLLQQIIKQTLPSVSAEATRRLAICNEELSKLPPPLPTEPPIYMLNLITALCSDVKRLVEGSSNEDTSALNLVQSNRKRFTAFREVIRETCPDFVAQLRQGSLRGLQEITLAGQALSSPMYLDDMKTYIDNSVARELPENVPYAAKLKLIRQFQRTWKDSAEECLQKVREDINSAILARVSEYFGRWEGLHSLIRSLIFDLVDEHLLLCRAAVNSYLDSERMPYTQNNHYYQTSKDKWLAIYKEQRAESTSNAAKSTLPSTTPKLSFTPRSPPKTTNPPLPAWSAFGGFSSSQEAPTSGTPSPTAPFAATPVPQAPRPFSFSVNGVSATASSGALKTTPVPLLGQPLSSADTDREQKIRDALSLLTSAGWDGLKPEDLGKLHPPDIYEREMNVMAEVRGYFKVSFKRVMDVVPMTIDLKLVHGVMYDMQEFLIRRMKLGATKEAAEFCERYLADDPSIVDRRQELTAHKEKLERVKNKLTSFGM